MDSIFNRKITIYDNVKSTSGRDATLAEFLLLGKEHDALITQIRNTEDDAERRKLKNQLPCATISGTFEGGHKAENLKEHSGLLCLDIDHINPDEVMPMLQEMEIISYASLSVSGKGIFAIVKLEYPEKHTEQYEALKVAFEYMGITLDKQTGDVSRLRYVSHDRNAWHRPNAETWKGLWKPMRKETTPTHIVSASIKPVKRINPVALTDSTLARVEACVRELEHRGLKVDYADWVYGLGMPLASLGETGRGYFHRLSQVDASQYNASECDAKFTNLLKSRHTIEIGSFFDYCTRLGINGKELLKQNS